MNEAENAKSINLFLKIIVRGGPFGKELGCHGSA
jgi:hypothetical protein